MRLDVEAFRYSWLEIFSYAALNVDDLLQFRSISKFMNMIILAHFSPQVLAAFEQLSVFMPVDFKDSFWSGLPKLIPLRNAADHLPYKCYLSHICNALTECDKNEARTERVLFHIVTTTNLSLERLGAEESKFLKSIFTFFWKNFNTP